MLRSVAHHLFMMKYGVTREIWGNSVTMAQISVSLAQFDRTSIFGK
jgi:hypothetical protein